MPHSQNLEAFQSHLLQWPHHHTGEAPGFGLRTRSVRRGSCWFRIEDVRGVNFELEDLSVWDGFEGVKSFEVEFSGVGNSTGGVVLELVMVRVLDLVPEFVRIGCLDEYVVGELFPEVWWPGSMMTILELGVDELGVGWLKRSGAVWVNWQPEY
ncbi:hypothetical protein Drorol1_Dr00021212, partial [Drosera rotundifolia]